MSGRTVRLLAIGALTGLAGGRLGVGGGFVMVPAMVYLLKAPRTRITQPTMANR